MRHLDDLYMIYSDLEKSQFLFNRAAVHIANPAAREVLCTLRETDMALIARVQREIAGVENKPQPAGIFVPDLDDGPSEPV